MGQFKPSIATMTWPSGSTGSAILSDDAFGQYAAITFHAPTGLTGPATLKVSPDTTAASPIWNAYQVTSGTNITIASGSSVQIALPAVGNFMFTGAAQANALQIQVTATHAGQ